MRNYTLFVFVFFVLNISAQTSSVVKVPELPVYKNSAYSNPNPNLHQSNQQQINPYNPNEAGYKRSRNEALINEATAYQQRIDNKNQTQSDIQLLASKGFPSQSYQKGTSCYYQAYDEINNMLQGKQALDLGRAVFLVENAYYNNSLNYTDYQNYLKQQVQLCNQKIKEEKLDTNDNLVKNMMLFRLISDTLNIKPHGTENAITHLPIKYDYEDYKSEKNYDSHFVTKLMQNGTGQCYSMPLYYLVLAEQIDAKAYWAFSPKHSFVKIQDEKGVWYNLELTCNAILSDAHYMNNSYIKAEAIRNRIYLEPLDKKQVVSEMLLELAKGYYTKYGLDDFYLQCTDTAKQYLSNDLDAIMLKAAYEESLTMTLAHLLDAKKPEIMKEKSPEAYKHYEQMQALYKQIDNLGYEELPSEIYARWLDYLGKQKAKTGNQKTILTNKLTEIKK